MEEELKCFHCKQFFRDPVLLTCNHAVCRICASALITPASSEYQEADKASVSSETDSGVVCASRPESYAAVGSSLVCPVCDTRVVLDENGTEGLPLYRVMRTLVEKFGNITPSAEESCQMCELPKKTRASVVCAQCSVRYCSECATTWHPARGPLADHELRPPSVKCPRHNLNRDLFCSQCSVPVCPICRADSHQDHDTQSLSEAAKEQRSELSKCLQNLSEQAKLMTDYIQTSKVLNEQESGDDLEQFIDEQFATISSWLESRRIELLRAARARRLNTKSKLAQVTDNAADQLHAAANLTHFAIEALKETDNAAFLQVGAWLCARAQSAAETLSQREFVASPEQPILHTAALRRTIRELDFIDCTPPEAPVMAVERCSARGSSATLAWRVPSGPQPITGYVLELDDGHTGPYKEVYCGRETVCTVEGLHYSSLYSARVKAFNSAGDGPYSEVIGLQTSSVAWFAWDARCADAEAGARVSSDGLTATVDGWEPHVFMADTGFLRGRHYWLLHVNAHDGHSDPAMGVACAPLSSRTATLGHDARAWAMYVDGVRSWLLHGGAHASRCDGGISVGSTVGVLLDMDKGTLRFTIDGRPQGGVAFTGLRGVLYPALSLSRGTAVTLEPGVTPPTDDELDEQLLQIQYVTISDD